APHGNGSDTVISSITVNDIAATSGQKTVSGTVEVDRNVTLTNGTSVHTATVHQVQYGVSASDGSIQKGGTATTTCSIQINGGTTFTRTYSWVFEGNGSAVLTTERGTTVTVTVE
ncbi:MAG TPA: hypothetical protein VMC79_13525, partial [Rectinemataceae bacterium]|nr:hypothetical protein [Rectinemataceae bacterium]